MSGTMYLKLKILIVFVILTGVAFTLLIGLKAQGERKMFKDEAKQIRVTVTQLKSLNGIIPVELQCEKADFISPNMLSGFSCILKNDTNKNILAAYIIYSISYECDGKEFIDKRFHLLETFIHSDFYEVSKSIGSKVERSFEISADAISTEDAPVSIVKGIEIKIDYVEFDDKTHLGNDEKGSKAITDLRQGAVSYKNWLVEKYTSNDKSIENVIQLLENDKPLPDALINSSKFKQYGAKTYRSRLREVYLKQGNTQIEKYLSGDSSDEK